MIFNYNKIAFNVIEFAGFILPALPNVLSIRVTILFIYFIAHYFKFQVIYSKFKANYIKD
jgi:uncharacterized protein YqgC (DUF456 family)